MNDGSLPTHVKGLLGGVLLLAAVHFVGAAPIYLGRGVPATKDLLLSYQPMHALLARQAWPPYRVWEPRGGLGFPMLAESQASQLYPPSVLARWILDPDLGIFPLLYLHLLLSGVFMLALARELELPLEGALIAALAWMGGGFLVSHVDIPPMLYEAAWLPAAAAGLVRHFRTGRLLPLAAAATALGCMLLAGHFQVAFYSFLFLFAWSWFIPAPLPRMRQRAVAAMMAVSALSVGLSYAQVKPTLDFFLHSGRSELGGGTWLSWLPLQLPTLVQPFLFGVDVRPTLLGRTPPELASYWGAGVYWETALYIGLAPLLLALMTWRRPGHRERFLWAALGVSLLLAAGRYVPGHSLLWRLPLWGGFRFPGRLLLLTHFCLALLAGYGAAQLREESAEGLRRLCRRFAGGMLVFFALLGLSWVVARQLAATGLPRAAKAALTLNPASRPNLQLVALALLVAVSLAAAARGRRTRAWLPWILVAATAIDLTHTFRAQQLLVPADFYARALPAYGCDEGRPEQRVFSVARFTNADPLDHQLDLLPPSLNLRTPCSTVDYRGSLYDARFSRYSRALLEAYAEPEGRLLETPRRLELFRLGGVRRFWRRGPANGEGLVFEGQEGARWTYRLEPAVPAVRRSPGARVVRDGEEAWRVVSAPGFDPVSDLVIEGEAAGTEGRDDPTGTVVVTSRDASHLAVETDGARPAWLVWSEAWSPRWRATIDGTAAPVWRANYLLQAVRVPPGRRRVQLEYYEPALWQGALSAALALCVFFVFSWHDRRGTRGMGRS